MTWGFLGEGFLDDIMEVEKKHSKGGFLNLFDWNGKSRKKLFSNNSELPERSKQGKENVENRAKSRLHMIETDESRASSSNKGSGDFNCASSVTSDEGYGTRAPGVVARLMGLDSIPTSNVTEPSSTPYFDSCSLRAPHFDRSNPNLWSEYHPMDYLNFPNKLEKVSWNSVESRPRKVQNRPIERFQTETLPPKSAKSIPITHHKLLSPIRNPGFFPSKNATYIIEAAAKIIEASPQPTTKGRISSIQSSSVPLRIRDLKKKMEAAHKASRPQRSNQPSAVKFLKGQCSDKRLTGSNNKSAFKPSINSEKNSSDSLRNKGKSVSLAVQAKVNVQGREGSTSSSNTSSKRQKEKNDVKVNQLYKSQPDALRNVQKGTLAKRTNNVLRQNNQKQNSMSNKDSATSKTSISNQQGRKTKSINCSTGPNRTVNKVVVNSEIVSRKKEGLVATDTRRKNLSQKESPVNGNLQFGESVTDTVMTNKDRRSIKYNIADDGCVNWAADNRKKSMDIVSFTFTSPIKRSMPDPEPSGQVVGKIKSFSVDSCGDIDKSYSINSTFPSPGFSVIGGDALSVLLEQKLRELTCKVESSHCNVIREGTSTNSASSLQDSAPILKVASTTSAENDKRLQLGLDKDKSESLDEFDYSSIDDPRLDMNQKWQFQQSESLEEQSINSNNSETGIEFDCRHPSPVSILEPSFLSGSCSDIKNSTDGRKQCLLAEAQVFSWLPTNDSTSMECETELSDSASSISFGDMGSKHTTKTFGLIDFKESSNWEFEYVKMIIIDAELMWEEFVLGQTHKVITPNLFDQLENQENGEEKSKLGQKILFDCVSECLDFRCRQTFVGSCKAWVKLGTLFRGKGWLAEEVYKEILGWKNMGDMMVDELLDKDMSTQYGRWLDFDIEAFEEGVDIEKGILNSLVDELVSDLI